MILFLMKRLEKSTSRKNSNCCNGERRYNSLKFLKVFTKGGALTYIGLALTIAQFIIEGITQKEDVREILEEEYDLKPVKKESDE